jgi:hypothetical protein
MISHLPAVVNHGKSVDNIISEYYWLKLISDEIFNSIESFPDDWLELSKLFPPSHINNFYDSGFQNIEKEGICYALFWYCVINWDRFQEIDINMITQPRITRKWYELNFLLDNGYLIENKNWKFVITNKLIKIFFKNWIFNLSKAKAKEKKDFEINQKYLKKKEIHKWVFDLVMELYLYITKIDKPSLQTFDEFRDYIEQKTNWVLTLKVFEKDGRWCWDVFIGVKGVTFESDPIRNNILVWYQNWRSETTLENAVYNFVSWIKNSWDTKFINDVGWNLWIDISQIIVPESDIWEWFNDKEKNIIWLTDWYSINIYWGEKQSLKWKIISIKFSDIPEEAKKHFIEKAEQYLNLDNFKQNVYLDLFLFKLDNWEKIYLSRVIKHFWKWEVDDCIFIYEEWSNWEKIGYWNLIKTIDWKDVWRIWIDFYRTLDWEKNRGYWTRKIFLLNYLSNIYFGENIKNICPITGSEGLFDRLVKKWYAKCIKLWRLYEMLDPIDLNSSDWVNKNVWKVNWDTSKNIVDILKLNS